MNQVIDGNFKFVNKLTPVYNSDIEISPYWRIKTTNGQVNSIVTQIDDGIQIDARFEQLGYIYVRQLNPDVKRYSNKSFVLKADITRASWQEIKYDVYISARFSASDADRITVIDTPSKNLARGKQTISVPFSVPNIDNREVSEVNALSVAIRFIGQNQNTRCLLNNVRIEEV